MKKLSLQRMDRSEFSNILLNHFPFETTGGQRILLDKLSEFILEKNVFKI